MSLEVVCVCNVMIQYNCNAKQCYVIYNYVLEQFPSWCVQAQYLLALMLAKLIIIIYIIIYRLGAYYAK